jgi:rod shape-determining protein MreD
MKKWIYYILTLWGVLWLQILLNHFLGGTWAAVDLILVTVLFNGLSRGPLVAEGMGFVWGILVDASSLGLMGIHAILYALSGYMAGLVRRQLDESKAWTQAIFSFGVSVLYALLYLGLDRIFGRGNRPMGWSLLIHPFANAVIAPLVFWLMERWAESWEIFPLEN